MKEHNADIVHEVIKKLSLAEHSKYSKHHLVVENTRVIANINRYRKWKVQETIEIEKHPKNRNIDDIWKLSKSCTPVLNLIKKH